MSLILKDFISVLRHHLTEYTLFFRLINLETDNITILDFTLTERQLGLHLLNHPRFDFLKIV